ncbi:isopenicillin N synthase family dioxygenase [Ferrimonas balearica]|uniref:isopenicillin N synthase family dioxygenase n=1 Tax=Ferrimonas balearica TaxID=44012 RepID=UPI001C9993F0|nr:2OG-Fe(II) oxygenase family protein [Ferrimonas balearica]MBY5922252.1 isopenicillin N synthase family oxygenase [Ferrimonas balearica]MBY5994408.1 isopenicillin N synthase family oxygenase [Ferrimonas balearica]
MKLTAVDYRAPDAPSQFVESLRQTGFGVLKNHPIPQQLVESIYQDWQGFFDGDSKEQYHFNRETQDGFFPATVSEVAKGHTVKDIKEYFHYYPWGQCPPEHKAQLASYYEQATSLAAELLTWVQQEGPAAVAAHYAEPLPSMIEGSDKSLLRVLHYPPLKGDETAGAIRAAAHEDINLLTILPAANAKGLQVKGRDGEWMDVPCDFGTLIVNIGDMLQEASGGYFPSTTHRVVNPEGEATNQSRISLPLFLHPRPEVVLSRRHTAHSYLMERLRELGVI